LIVARQIVFDLPRIFADCHVLGGWKGISIAKKLGT